MFYHVSITPKTLGVNKRRLENELDLTADSLKNRFLIPYREGRPIIINGRTIVINDLERIKVYESQRRITGLRIIPWASMDDVTSQYITGEPGSLVEIDPSQENQRRPATDARDVFVVRGRNDRARDALFQFLRAIDLHPLEWSEAVAGTGRASPYIGEILDAAFSQAHAVVVLFTPDDEARLKEEYRVQGDPPHEIQLSGQARPNVLFEAGMAMSRSEDRTVLIELGRLRPFSDIAGRHAIRLDNSSQRRQELAERLRTAGCPVNTMGTDWHTAGDFDAAISDINEVPLEVHAVDQPALSDTVLWVISEDAQTLLSEVAKDANSGSGQVIIRKTLGGTFIRTNGKDFSEPNDRRSVARWESAISELESLGFLEDPAGNRNVFQITHAGFEAADNG